MSKVSTRDARRMALIRYGPTATAARASHRVRDERFRVVYIADHTIIHEGKEKVVKALFTAGAGSDWDEAFANAEKNPVAEKHRALVAESAKDLGEYMKDPVAFEKRAMEEMKRQLADAQEARYKKFMEQHQQKEGDNG